jgi:hypothetical protein
LILSPYGIFFTGSAPQNGHVSGLSKIIPHLLCSNRDSKLTNQCNARITAM